jgi:hypothetical protein
MVVNYILGVAFILQSAAILLLAAEIVRKQLRNMTVHEPLDAAGFDNPADQDGRRKHDEGHRIMRGRDNDLKERHGRTSFDISPTELVRDGR